MPGNKGTQGFARPGSNAQPRNLAIGQGAYSNADIGLAIGKNCTAAGLYSTTIGNNNFISGLQGANAFPGLNAQVFGRFNFVSAGGFGAISVGLLNNQTGGTISTTTGIITGIPVAATTGRLGVIFGISNTCSSPNSIAIGRSNSCSGNYDSAIAVGVSNTISGVGNIAFGVSNTASSNGQNITIGYSNAANATGNGTRTASIGSTNTASGSYTTCVGNSNVVAPANDNCSLFGKANFAILPSNTAIGVCNNSKTVTLTLSTGATSGTPAAANTIGRLTTTVGAFNTTVSHYATALGLQNNADGISSLAIGYANSMNSVSLNCQLVGRQNFGTSTSFASIGIGVLNNQQSGTLTFSTGAITGTPAAAATVGRLCTAVGILNTTSGNYSGAIGLQNTASANYSYAFGANVNNSTANSAELGADNTNKLHTDSTGLQFASRYLPQVLSTTTGIDGKAVATTNLYTVPAGKILVVTHVMIRCSTATAVSIAAAASIDTSGGKTIYASQTLTGLTVTTKAFSFINNNATQDLSPAADVVRLNIGTGATATTQTLVVDLIGYLV